ncbi:MAG TPA: hypothetical protein VEM96_14600 [Pyrinomonadaceae bacterium]|nr:hypothetical protein [Pyrinomonadaceae bacterium]
MFKAVRKEVVARSLVRLREQKTHTLFVGYLYLQQRSSQLGRLEDLQPDFLSFFRKFFIVGSPPLGAPYIKLFPGQKPSTRNLWLNENVAGSYAPSSLRPGQPFRKVVNIQDRKYSLPVDHAQRAQQHLLYNNRVEVADLATVLYRDFGLIGDPFTIEDLIDVFAYEFGYTNSPGEKPNQDFRKLYSLETARTWDEDWLATP